MPAPVQPIPIPFVSDLSEAKRQFDEAVDGWRGKWDAFVAYCAQHQPTFEGRPANGSAPPAASPPPGTAPTTTFGGLTANGRPGVLSPASLPTPAALDPAQLATTAATAAAAAGARELTARLATIVAIPAARPPSQLPDVPGDGDGPDAALPDPQSTQPQPGLVRVAPSVPHADPSRARAAASGPAPAVPATPQDQAGRIDASDAAAALARLSTAAAAATDGLSRLVRSAVSATASPSSRGETAEPNAGARSARRQRLLSANPDVPAGPDAAAPRPRRSLATSRRAIPDPPLPADLAERVALPAPERLPPNRPTLPAATGRLTAAALTPAPRPPDRPAAVPVPGVPAAPAAPATDAAREAAVARRPALAGPLTGVPARTAGVLPDVPAAAAQSPPTPRAPAGRPVSPLADLSHLPDYVREPIERRYAVAERAGVVPQIEALSYDQRLTAGQVPPRLGNASLADPSDPDVRPLDVVRAVRTRLGIPSQDQPAEFEAARGRYLEGRAAAPGASLGREPAAGAAVDLSRLAEAARAAAAELGRVRSAVGVAARAAAPRLPPATPPADPATAEAAHVGSPNYLSRYNTGDPEDRRHLVGRLRDAATPADRLRLLEGEATGLLDVRDRGAPGLTDADRRTHGRAAAALLAEADRYAPGTSAAHLAYHDPRAEFTPSPDLQARRLALLPPAVRDAYVSQAVAADAAVGTETPGTEPHRAALAHQRLVRARAEYGAFGPPGGRRYYGLDAGEDLGPVTSAAPVTGGGRPPRRPPAVAEAPATGGDRVPPGELPPPGSPAGGPRLLGYTPSAAERVSVPGGGGPRRPRRPRPGSVDADGVIEAEFEPVAPPGAIARTSGRQRGPSQTSPGDAGTVFHTPPRRRPPPGTYGGYAGGGATGGATFVGDGYGDPAGSYGGRDEGPVGPSLPNGSFYSSPLGGGQGIHLRGGEGDPVQRLLQTGARTHLLPRYLPRAYEAAGGAVGLAGGYLAVEGFRSLGRDFMAENAYGNAEAVNVTGDQGTRLGNQLQLYDAERGANPFARVLNDPLGTQRADVQRTYALAGFQDQRVAVDRSRMYTVLGNQAAVLGSSEDPRDRLAAVGVRSQAARATATDTRRAGLETEMGQVRDLQGRGRDAQGSYVRRVGHNLLERIGEDVGDFGGSNASKRLGQWAGSFWADHDVTAGQGEFAQADTLSSQIRAKYGKQQAQDKATQDRDDAQAAAVVVRSEAAADVYSKSSTRSLNLRGTDDREASRDSIVGGFDARIAATGNPFEKQRLGEQKDAALRAEGRDYTRDTSHIEAGDRVSVLGSQATGLSALHYDQAAAFTGIDAQRGAAADTLARATEGIKDDGGDGSRRIRAAQDAYAATLGQLSAQAAGLTADFAAQRAQMGRQDRSRVLGLLGDTLGSANEATNAEADEQERLHPELKPQYERRRTIDLAANSLGDQRQQYGVGIGTVGLFQQARNNDLRTQGLDRTASVQALTDSGVSDILQARADPYLQAHPDLLQGRIAGIEAERTSAARSLTEQAGGGRAFAVTGQYVSRPGRPYERQTRDLDAARRAESGQSAAFAEAAQGRVPAFQGAQQLAGRSYATVAGRDTDAKAAAASYVKLEQTVAGITKKLDDLTRVLKNNTK